MMNSGRKFFLIAAGVFVAVMAISSWFFLVFLPHNAGTPEALADIEAHWKAVGTEKLALPAEELPPGQSARLGKSGKRPPQRSAAKQTGSAKHGPTTSQAATQGIRAIDSSSFIISKTLFDEAVEHPQAAFQGVTATQSEKPSGQSRFTVHGIGPGSLLYKAGLRSGDELQRINGYEIDSPDSVLVAYAALRAAKSYRLDLQRKGRPVSLYYKVE